MTESAADDSTAPAPAPAPAKARHYRTRITTYLRDAHLRVISSVGSIWILALGALSAILLALLPETSGSPSSSTTTAVTGTAFFWLLAAVQVFGGVRLWRWLPAFDKPIPPRPVGGNQRLHPLHNYGRLVYFAAGLVLWICAVEIGMAIRGLGGELGELSAVVAASTVVISVAANRGIAKWNDTPSGRREIAAFLATSSWTTSGLVAVMAVVSTRSMLGTKSTGTENDMFTTLLYAVTFLLVPAALWILLITGKRRREGESAAG